MVDNFDIDLKSDIQINVNAALASLKQLDSMLSNIVKKLESFEKTTLGKNISQGIANISNKIDNSIAQQVRTKMGHEHQFRKEEAEDKRRYISNVKYNSKLIEDKRITALNEEKQAARKFKTDLKYNSQVIEMKRKADERQANINERVLQYEQKVRNKLAQIQAAKDIKQNNLDYALFGNNAKKPVSSQQGLNNLQNIQAQNEKRIYSEAQKTTREKEKQLRLQQQQNRASGNFLDSLFNIRNALMLITASYLARFIQGIIQTTQRLQSIDVKFQAIAGSASLAKEQMDWVWKRAEQLKVPVLEASEGFAQFYAAASGSGMANSDIKSIYDSLMQTSLVLHLSKDRFKLASLAFEQMINKGVVSMEELRRQLGEHVPGAFMIAAKAMGLSGAELNDLIKGGELASDVFLKKFAPALVKVFGSGVPLALNMVQAKLTDLDNKLKNLQRTFSEGGFAEAVGNIADALAKIIDNPKFKNTIKNTGEIVEKISKNIDKILPALMFIVNFIIGVSLVRALKGILVLMGLIKVETAFATAGISIIAGLLANHIVNNLDKVMNKFNIITQYIQYFRIKGIGAIDDIFNHFSDRLNNIAKKDISFEGFKNQIESNKNPKNLFYNAMPPQWKWGAGMIGKMIGINNQTINISTKDNPQEIVKAINNNNDYWQIMNLRPMSVPQN